MSKNRKIRVILGIVLLACLLGCLGYIISKNAEAQKAAVVQAAATSTPPPPR